MVDGRFEVNMPWKDGHVPTELPDSYSTALRRLESSERRLRREPSIADAYSDIISKYTESSTSGRS